jgi:hypothetical protein
MMKAIITSAIALTTLTLGAISVSAQPSTRPAACVPEANVSGGTVTVIADLSRAKNLARRAAEQTNGGLGEYRAETSMHGPVSQTPCVDNGDGTVTFTFKGGAPGASEMTVESVVTVAKDASKVTIDYNGAIREATADAQTPIKQDNGNLTLVRPNNPDINRAKNLARQAAERANGGLDVYRAEPAMYGPSTGISVQEKDEAWTFIFKGSAPGSSELTIESEVTVSKNFSQVTIDYNGPVRSPS